MGKPPHFTFDREGLVRDPTLSSLPDDLVFPNPPSGSHPGVASFSGAGDRLSFNRDIRPILSDACFACHGFDAKKRKADLRLDTADGARADLGGYAAIVRANPAKSEAWLRIVSEDEDEVMPPPDHHKALTAEQKETIRRWIQEGAEYQQHWSFVAPAKAAVPAVSGVVNPIDAFLQDRLKKEGLSPAAEASREP